MSEETWYKMLIVSFALHILVVAAFSIPLKGARKKIDLSSSYSVNLVGGPGGGGVAQREVPAQAKKAPTPEKSIPAKEVAPPSARQKPVPIKKEDLVSLSKKKVPEKQGATDEELQSLQEKIKNIRRKTEYLDVAKSARSGTATSGRSGGPAGLGEGGGGAIDPVLQKYKMEVEARIQEAWHKPAISKRGLPVVEVAFTVRRDGIVTEIDPEKMSGNRIYDESVLRAVKTATLPRMPTSIKEDSMEFVVRFNPEDLY